MNDVWIKMAEFLGRLNGENVGREGYVRTPEDEKALEAWKEKELEFDWKKEKPCILLILLLCAYVALIIWTGFIPATVIVFPVLLYYCGERKPAIYLFTVAAGIGIFFLFKYVFHVSLPGIPGLGG